jgi:drug/metabolite transporter (DMT)-like permease
MNAGYSTDDMKIFPIILGLCSGLLFGLATPISKMSLSYLNSFQLAGLLYIGSGLAFLPYIISHRKFVLQSLRASASSKYILGIILFGGLLGPLFLMLGLRAANAMSVSIWLNLELVATAILGFLLFKENIGKYSLIGILLTLSAGVLVSYRERSSGLTAGVFVLLACICWGIDNQITAIIDGITPQTTTFIKGMVGGSINLLIGTIIGAHSMSPSHICIALIIGVVSYGFSIFLYITSAQYLGATRSQILFSTSPFWGIAAAHFLLKEPVDPSTAIAIAALAAGIVFSNIPSHDHLHSHAQITHIHLHSHDDAHHTHIHEDNFNPHLRHIHEHTHEPITHSHQHYPDIHHRHTHS